ncbi:hypothetical protein ALP70_01081 [Pseudomonas savastanoi]|uniref:Uncharacterized protein n=1 Tax=Pseudomonas savastanoi TaxID=29438 RepID=A0A3M5BZS4_PSESS|nr:hypothetical protein ALP70_01081 [Pseudomonas savastanoi]
MNYLTVHKQSNLVQSVIASSSTPTDTPVVRFIPAPDALLDKFYKLAQKLKHLVPVGDLAAVSPYFLEALGGNAELPPRISTRPRPRKHPARTTECGLQAVEMCS